MHKVSNRRCLFSKKPMAKVDSTDPAFYMNPSAYTQVKNEKKTKGLRRGERAEFSRMFDNFRGKTADELGALRNLPVSDDSINLLMDEVRDAGDVLKSRPLPEEILRYKQAVRNFINYVVKNSLTLEHEDGIQKFMKPRKRYAKISIIDKKLEDLAAMLLSSQKNQLILVSRLEEIRGLLIDLLQ